MAVFLQPETQPELLHFGKYCVPCSFTAAWPQPPRETPHGVPRHKHTTAAQDVFTDVVILDGHLGQTVLKTSLWVCEGSVSRGQYKPDLG